MRGRLIREDLVGNNPLLEAGRLSYDFYWYRWDSGYELVQRDGEEPYFRALRIDDPSNIFWYPPLVATPHLFLDFARLQERKDVDGAIRAWISDYGLLGLELAEPSPFRDGTPTIMHYTGEHSMEGGPGETLAKFRAEVREANEALVLYEAAVSKDVGKLEQALKADDDSRDAHWRRDRFLSFAKDRDITYADALVHKALQWVFESIQDVLEAFTYPCLVHYSSSESPPICHVWTPETMKSSLWPRNLLGAMYLQFLWMIDGASELSRCKYCSRIISYAPPRPLSGARKPRKDKQFCDKRCRQNYHYNSRVKTKPRSS